MIKAKKQAQADMSTVYKYKHFNDLRDCLASGWAATTVREYLIRRYGPEGVPSLKAIERWRNKHLEPTARVIPHQVVQRKLKGVTYRVDIIGHLSRLVALCEDRVARGLEHEENSGGKPLTVNDGAIQTYLQVLKDYVKVAQDLGILPSRPAAPLVDARALSITPEMLQQLRETVREIRLLEGIAL